MITDGTTITDYSNACGFTTTSAGLINLKTRSPGGQGESGDAADDLDRP